MEKRLPKRSLQNENVQSRCVWGLVDIFDFGNGGSNQKLLTNGRRTVQRTVSDIEHLRKVQTIGSCSGKSQVFEVGTGLEEKHESGAFDQSIKNLLKEEFATLKESKKLKEASKKQLKKSDFELVLKQLQDDHKKPSKTSMTLADQLRIQLWKDKFLLGPEQSSSSTYEVLWEKQNLEAMFGDICSQIYQENVSGGDVQKVIIPSRYNELDQVNMQLLQITAKAFVDQIYINGKDSYEDGISSKSKYFSDALEILNLNMDLFLKLLQDSNSLLQFPARDNERMKLYLDSRPSECGSSLTRNNQVPEDTMKIQKRSSNNPLWKKLKDRYGCSSKGNTTCQASKKIVILKPISKSNRNSEDASCFYSSLQAHPSSKNKGQNMKSNYFSFKDIKKKFKQAVGENQQKPHLISLDEHLRRLARKKHLLKDADTENSSGPCKGKSDVPSHAGETACKNLNSSPSSSSKQRQLDIFMEAKRHLSERLRNVDMGEISERKEAPRTLKMVLSSPEQDHFLTTYSPKRDKMTMSNTLQNEKEKKMDFPSLLKQTEELPSCDCRRYDDSLGVSEFRPKISKKLHADPEPSGSVDIPKANEVLLQRSSNLLEAPYEFNCSYDANSSQGTETTKKYEDNRYMDSSDLTVPSENRPLRSLLGSSRSLTIHELEIADTAKYKEHASPVSVLEPFSPEDVYSPIFVADKQYESSLQPRRLDFDDYSQVSPQEDPKSNQNLFMDAEESLHIYVKAVMEASELSFDDIYIKGPSTEDVLYTCIADKMGSCPIESYTELQLLFDCIHEILLGLYKSHFECPPWLSFLRQRIRSLPLEKDVIDEVVKEVNTTLLPKMEQLPMLNELMKKDIAKSGSWIDLCPDAEQILIQIAEEVLQDSVVDTILEVLV